MADQSWRDIQSDADAANASDKTHYVLQLFVTGVTGNSLRALANLKEICETYLAGRYTLDVIDRVPDRVAEHGEAGRVGGRGGRGIHGRQGTGGR